METGFSKDTITEENKRMKNSELFQAKKIEKCNFKNYSKTRKQENGILKFIPSQENRDRVV